MEDYEESREIANEKLLAAKNALEFTYKVTKEPKLLFTITENSFYAMENMLDAMLSFELLYKRIDPYRNDFGEKISLLKNHLMRKYSLPFSHAMILSDLYVFIEAKKKAPIQFARGDSMVICSREYDCKKLTPERALTYFQKAKVFIDDSNSIISKNERKVGRIN